jgi:hypothetical protein
MGCIGDGIGGGRGVAVVEANPAVADRETKCDETRHSCGPFGSKKRP